MADSVNFSEFRLKSRSRFKGQHILDKSILKAKRSEFVCVYSVQDTAVLLERNVVFHRTVKHIDECLLEIARKTTRSLEFIGMAEENYPSKKHARLFLRNIRQNLELKKSAVKSGTPRLPTGKPFKNQYLQN